MKLLALGATVVAVLHKEPNESLESMHKRHLQKEELVARIAPGEQARLMFIEGDITCLKDMETLFQTQQPDVLIHAAAILIPPVRPKALDDAAFDPKLRAEYLNACERFIEINRAMVLADCAARYQKNINPNLYCLLISTIHVFNLTLGAIKEETVHAPASLYPESKDMAEQHWSSILNPDKFCVVYPPQVFAPHQFTPAIIPVSVQNLIEGEGDKRPVSGSMNPIHVDNLINLLIALCVSSEKGRFCVSGDGVMTFE